MASRRRKKRTQPDPIMQVLTTLARAEVVGAVLVLLALFTLLSLVTESRGWLTAWWIDLLRQTVGVGVWGAPIMLGILGLWAVIRAMEKMQDLPWQRPAGFGLVFLAAISAITLMQPPDQRLLLAQQGRGGGWLGLQVGGGLESFLSPLLAWMVLTIMLIGGMVLIADRWLVDGALTAWDGLSRLGQGRVGSKPEPIIQPSLPLPQGEMPWIQRLRNWFGRLQMPAILGGEPPLPTIHDLYQAGPETGGAANATGQADAPRSRGVVTPARDNAPLTPRIVGGAQEWRLPRIEDMLEDRARTSDSDEHIRHQGRLIQETLALFGVPADFEGAYKGPAVTQYLIKPGYVERTVRGETKKIKVKVSKIASLANDLALALAAPSVRIEAPIPGTSYVGVEVPNREGNKVGMKDLMLSDVFKDIKGILRIALGEDVKGQPIVTDLTRMPHLLIAGATGAGKSVCINSIVSALLLTHTPDTLRFLMVDPKMVELSVYNGIPHLLSPVVTEVDKASGVLYWAVKEMERRYQLLSKANVRDLNRYNSYLVQKGERPLPYIVIIVDEMADLMMASPEEVEKYICRLAQMARAIGIHLIIATQRPSVDVITGLIKANFPSRIAFAVSSQVDSRVILDVPGAERLLGRGDMLFMAPDASKLERLQGALVDDDEINRLVHYWKGIRSMEVGGQIMPTGGVPFSPPPLETGGSASAQEIGAGSLPPTQNTRQTASRSAPTPSTPTPRLPLGEQQSLFEQVEAMQSVDSRDELFDDAVRVVLEAGRGSVSLLQRKLRVGYSRASRLVDQLEEADILGPDQGGSQGREVLSTDLHESPAAGDHSSPPSKPRVWM